MKPIGVVHSGNPNWGNLLGVSKMGSLFGVIYLGNQLGMQIKNFMGQVGNLMGQDGNLMGHVGNSLTDR